MSWRRKTKAPFNRFPIVSWFIYYAVRTTLAAQNLPWCRKTKDPFNGFPFFTVFLLRRSYNFGAVEPVVVQKPEGPPQRFFVSTVFLPQRLYHFVAVEAVGSLMRKHISPTSKFWFWKENKYPETCHFGLPSNMHKVHNKYNMHNMWGWVGGWVRFPPTQIIQELSENLGQTFDGSMAIHCRVKQNS